MRQDNKATLIIMENLILALKGKDEQPILPKRYGYGNDKYRATDSLGEETSRTIIKV